MHLAKRNLASVNDTIDGSQLLAKQLTQQLIKEVPKKDTESSLMPKIRLLLRENEERKEKGVALRPSLLRTCDVLLKKYPLLTDLELEGRVYGWKQTRDSPELQFKESIAACLKLPSRCTHLEFLTVPGFGSDALSEQLALHCPNLKVLSLGDSSLSVDSIVQLAIGCPQLTSIWNVGIGQLLAEAIFEHDVSFAHLDYEEFSLRSVLKTIFAW